jgi:serine carboxypeptidase-like clade 4
MISQFRDTLLSPWYVNGKVAGFNKIVGYLELRTVNDAGHLVPMDQGEAALEMVKNFIKRTL